MRGTGVLVVVLTMGTLGSLARPAASAPAEHYIVVLKDSVSHPGSVAEEHRREHGAQVSHVYRYSLKGYAAALPANRADEVRSDRRVSYVAPDLEVELAAQTLPTGIDRSDAELSPTAQIDGSDKRVDVDVAIIDTGIDLDHPDLNVVGGQNCSTGRRFDDGHGHGTHVAGTVAALDNQEGVVGMAPGARLWAVRVLNNAGSGSLSSVVCGIDWITANASTIEVANMSLGGSGRDDGNCGLTNNDPEHQAICEAVAAGVTFAVAAGNSSDDSANHVPAAYDEVVTVSALADFDGEPGGLGSPTCRTDGDDTLANFSNFGPDVDLIAPGVCINSTWKGGGYNTISGTSMASPHAAGAAALYVATHPGASPDAVKTALQAAGNLDWDDGDDPDAIKEVLVNVSTF